jgi:polysaccharide export outer membrane protein
MRLLVVCLLFISFAFVACESQKKVPYNYLENVSDTTHKETAKDYEPVIQKTDLLYIRIYTTTTESKLTDAQWNLPLSSGSSSGGTGTSALDGFLVDLDGNIDYPHIGIIHAEGLTKKQLADTIKSRIPESALTNPSVIVRFMNYRVTVLGEVGHAGTFEIPYERVTVLEAIGLAGDIPLTGKKTNVRVIRTINGEREYGTIDLTSKDLFNSPYFYLTQNDIVYVEPRKSKLRSNEQSIVAQRIAFALTIVTSAGIIYSIFK